MSTALFNNIIFGPIRSRRLGISLGVNLLPLNSKLCTFNCIYCECGWNPKHPVRPMLPSREMVKSELEIRLRKMAEDGQLPNVITFAGNGEPTLHPDFEGIIDDTIVLRDQFAPEAKVAVLSNATMTYKEEVVRALKKVNDNILKLDSGMESTIRLMNGPVSDFSLDKLIDNLQKFNGKLIVQTMFLKGEINGTPIDNTTDEEVNAWILAIQKIKPAMVMLYSIDRDTPAKNLIKVDAKTLRRIAAKVKVLNIRVQVAV